MNINYVLRQLGVPRVKNSREGNKERSRRYRQRLKDSNLKRAQPTLPVPAEFAAEVREAGYQAMQQKYVELILNKYGRQRS